MIQLGQQGKDKITGFEGIVTAQIQYLTGCTQYNLVPPVKDGKLPGAEWFDEARIEITGNGVLPADVTGERNGGPNRDCPR